MSRFSSVTWWRSYWASCAGTFYGLWCRLNFDIIKLSNAVEFEVTGDKNLKKDAWYLLICNHRTWLDVLTLASWCHGRIPLPKFFMKEQLKYIPILGTGCQALDMPFMKRYTKEKMAANPNLRGVDIQTTRQSCERFALQPTTIINFVEGTRFNDGLHAALAAQGVGRDLRNLLPAKAAGVAFTLAAMGSQFDAILDCTLIYPDNSSDIMWNVMSGKLRRVLLDVQTLPLDSDVIGDYYNDDTFRDRFQQWLNVRWALKDKIICDRREKLQRTAAKRRTVPIQNSIILWALLFAIFAIIGSIARSLFAIVAAWL